MFCKDSTLRRKPAARLPLSTAAEFEFKALVYHPFGDSVTDPVCWPFSVPFPALEEPGLLQLTDSASNSTKHHKAGFNF